MFSNARSWGVVAGGLATAIAGVLTLTGTAAAEPVLPGPSVPGPAPVTVTQTVTVAPAAAGLTPSATATPVAPAPTLTPASSGTLREFFGEKAVQLEPQDPRVFRALQITLPLPTGWTQVPDPNVPDAYAVIADRAGGDGLYTSNAQVVIYRLVGEFDPKEAITHGFIDSQQLPAWQSTDASLADFGGFPSSLIEGAYRENEMMLNTSRRHVIATSGPDKYLVTLSVTTAVNQAVAAADATDAIANGFRVTDPAAVAATPTPTLGVAPPAALSAVPAATS